jgi:hypothetical protein
MVAPNNFAWSFRDVSIYAPGKAVFVAGDDDAVKKDIPISWIFTWTGQWGSQSIPIIGTSVTKTYHTDLNLLIMGIDGTVYRWGKGPIVEELIDSSEKGPQNYGDLQEIRTIEEQAYVVGMRRTVYRCDKAGKWTRIDHGIRCSEDDESDAGFNSIDGFNASNIYAVGWDGEIWYYNGKKWKQIESPTNLALFRVVCSEDGNIYACGQKGLIIKGRQAKWEVIEQGETDETFWGATWFKNSLYLSTSNGIFQLQNDKLSVVDIKSKGKKKIKITPNNCFYRLDSNNDIMYSAGQKMVIYTEDGIKWTETPYK